MNPTDIQTEFKGVESLYPQGYTGQTEAGFKEMLQVMLVYMSAYAEGKGVIPYPNDGLRAKNLVKPLVFERCFKLGEIKQYPPRGVIKLGSIF